MATIDIAIARMVIDARSHNESSLSSLLISVLRSCNKVMTIKSIGSASPVLSDSGTKAPAKIAIEAPLDELNLPHDSLHTPRPIITGRRPRPSALALLIWIPAKSKNRPPCSLAITADMNHANIIAQYVDRTTQSLA